MGLVKEVIKEIGNKSREFYEFILPPIDMYINENNLKVVIDVPGFSKKDIELTLCGDILSIKAKKK
jgi:heat shock protein Hsp20